MAGLSIRFAALAFALILAGSCDLPDNDASDPDAPIFLNPVVVSTLPKHQGIGVPSTVVVIARFSQAMDASTLTPATFRLTSAGGPVSGSLSLSADKKDAVFTPQSPLANETLYTATLDNMLRNTTGQALTADYVWTFTTGPSADWDWTPPELLETAPGDVNLTSGGPDIDIDDAENACAVWAQFDGSVFQVYSSRSSQGGAWSTPEAIAGSAGGSTPVVAIDASGEALAVWAEGPEIWARRATMTGAWSDPEAVGTTTGGWTAILYDVFVDPSGNAILFYFEDRSGAAYDDVYAVRYDPASGWLTRTAIPTHHQTFPKFASDASGAVAAIWTPVNNGLNVPDHRVVVRRFTSAAGWLPDETVDPHADGRDVKRVSMTLDGAGHILAHWLRRDLGGDTWDYQIYASLKGPSTPWSPAELVAAPSGQAVTNQAAALSPDGTIAVTWDNLVTWQSWSRIRSVMGDWGPAQSIGVNPPNQTIYCRRPFFSGDGRISVLGQGEVFLQGGGSYGTLWLNEYSPATGWGTWVPFRTATGQLSYINITTDGVGRAAALWAERETPDSASVYSVWWSRFR